MKNNFANNLKHLRVQNGMTQEELAKKIGKDYSTIGKWELGQRSPIMEDVIKLSELFGVSLETFIVGDVISNNSKTRRTEEEQKEALKQALKDKGILNKNDNISKEDFDRLMKFIDNNKDLLIKK